jgi:hypothetical protein
VDTTPTLQHRWRLCSTAHPAMPSTLRPGSNVRYRTSWRGARRRASAARSDYRRHLAGPNRRARPAGSRRARAYRHSWANPCGGPRSRQRSPATSAARPPDSSEQLAGATASPPPRNEREPPGNARDARFAGSGRLAQDAERKRQRPGRRACARYQLATVPRPSWIERHRDSVSEHSTVDALRALRARRRPHAPMRHQVPATTLT